MKKNELIEILQKIEGNLEVKISCGWPNEPIGNIEIEIDFNEEGKQEKIILIES